MASQWQRVPPLCSTAEYQIIYLQRIQYTQSDTSHTIAQIHMYRGQVIQD